MASLSEVTTGVVHRPPELFIVGPPKSGKSTFAGSIPGAIAIPVGGEEGMDAIDCAKFPTANSYAEVLDSMRELYKEKHDYKAVIIDSVSALEPLIWREVCQKAGVDHLDKVAGGYGKGYERTVIMARKMLNGLDALRDKDMITVIIGHTAVKTFQDPVNEAYDHYVPTIHSKLSDAVSAWADAILFVGRKVIKKERDVGFGKKKAKAIEGGRALFTGHNPAYPADGRGVYGHLPPEMELDWNVFKSEVDKLIKARNKKADKASEPKKGKE